MIVVCMPAWVRFVLLSHQCLQLQVDPSSLDVVVPLCPLSQEEMKYFLTKYGVKVNDLPKLESQSELESDSEFKQNDAKIFYLEEFIKSKQMFRQTTSNLQPAIQEEQEGSEHQGSPKQTAMSSEGGQKHRESTTQMEEEGSEHIDLTSKQAHELSYKSRKML